MLCYRALLGETNVKARASSEDRVGRWRVTRWRDRLALWSGAAIRVCTWHLFGPKTFQTAEEGYWLLLGSTVAIYIINKSVVRNIVGIPFIRVLFYNIIRRPWDG